MPTSTERPMFGPLLTGLARRMDEPTLDCWCGEYGQVELQLQSLSDRADWTIYHRCVRCHKHALSILDSVLEYPLEGGQRIVLMPL